MTHLDDPITPPQGDLHLLQTDVAQRLLTSTELAGLPVLPRRATPDSSARRRAGVSSGRGEYASHARLMVMVSAWSGGVSARSVWATASCTGCPSAWQS